MFGRNGLRRILWFCLFFLPLISGCGHYGRIANTDMEFEDPGEKIPIRIIVGDTIVDGYLLENGTAQTFAKMLPLTVDLWPPIEYAQAFDLPERIPDHDKRTREYEQGAIGYWYEGPSIALLYGPDGPQTAVPIVKIGYMTSNISVFETYRDKITVERAEN